MLFPHLIEFSALADRWENSAKNLVKYDPANLSATTLQQNAIELRELVTATKTGQSFLTVTEYASAHGVSAQSVRNWIRAGELEAIRGQGRALMIRQNTMRKAA